jgi:hypothetical protein
MQNHLPAAVALLAPYVNSYRRYVPDFAAPINLEWGRDNRTTGLRVPISGPEARRVENRLAGMDCNPYLGLAASLACGYLGLIEAQGSPPECLGDAYISEDELPLTLGRRAGPDGGQRPHARGAGRRIHQCLRIGQAQRIQGVPASDLALGARASAAERLSIAHACAKTDAEVRRIPMPMPKSCTAITAMTRSVQPLDRAGMRGADRLTGLCRRRGRPRRGPCAPAELTPSGWRGSRRQGVILTTAREVTRIDPAKAGAS